MKRLLILSCVLAVFSCASSVASVPADVGKHEVSKTDVVLVGYTMEFNFAVTGYEFEPTIVFTPMVAIMPEPATAMSASSSNVAVNEGTYSSPDVRRKWIWWFSMVTNS